MLNINTELIMKILIYSESQDLNGWLKETFKKQELTFTKTASELGDQLGNQDLLIVDYQADMEDTVWEVCEHGFSGKIALVASRNLSKTQKVANVLNRNYNNVEAYRLEGLKGYSARKVCKMLGVDYSEVISKEAQITKKVKQNIDRQRKEFQSIFDTLLDALPGLLSVGNQSSISDHSADRLYQIWKDKGNKISEGIYRKPIDVKSEDIAMMEKEGLVKMNHDKVAITEKGKEVLNVMILGDERSIFNHDGSNPKYVTALANTDVASRMKKKGQK